MNIIINVIPHHMQRYITYGDWEFINNNLIISVSQTEEKYECLLAIHELVEAILCKKAGITQEIVDQWDKSHPLSDDPGYLPGCPYRNEHIIATTFEKLLAQQLDVNWLVYEDTLEKL